MTKIKKMTKKEKEYEQETIQIYSSRYGELREQIGFYKGLVLGLTILLIFIITGIK